MFPPAWIVVSDAKRVGRPGGGGKSPGLVTFTLQTTNDGQK